LQEVLSHNPEMAGLWSAAYRLENGSAFEWSLPDWKVSGIESSKLAPAMLLYQFENAELSDLDCHDRASISDSDIGLLISVFGHRSLGSLNSPGLVCRAVL
jgi:hypothetical protein